MGQTFEVNDGMAAVSGVNKNHTDKAGYGVYGESDGTAVFGKSHTWHGVVGVSDGKGQGFGVWGTSSTGGTGVIGESTGWHGTAGFSKSTSGGAGVYGEGVTGAGVAGVSKSGSGAVGVSTSGYGVHGRSDQNEGVHAESNSANTAAIAAYALNPTGTGAAIYAESRGKGPAAVFKGSVRPL